MKFINGMPVIIVPPTSTPKFKLSDKLILSTEFKKEIDKWINDFFGFYHNDVIDNGNVLRSEGKLFMNSSTFTALNAAIGQSK